MPITCATSLRRSDSSVTVSAAPCARATLGRAPKATASSCPKTFCARLFRIPASSTHGPRFTAIVMRGAISRTAASELLERTGSVRNKDRADVLLRRGRRERRRRRAANVRSLRARQRHLYRQRIHLAQHDRPRDGLRHDRHRARLRAREVQEARRRRLLQDRQSVGRGRAAQARLHRKSRSTRSRPTPRARARSKRRRTSIARRSRPKASTTKRLRASKPHLPSAFELPFVIQQVRARRRVLQRRSSASPTSSSTTGTSRSCATASASRRNRSRKRRRISAAA